MRFDPADEFPHDDAAVDEWLFAAWRPDGSAGVVSGHRLVGRRAWYWSAVVEVGHPVLHLTEWDVKLRFDPFIVKAPEMWAEHHCVAAFEQWSIGNEGHFAALDDADEALGRAYGTPEPSSADLEWYATAGPSAIEHGYEQAGVVHGVVELLGRPHVTFVEAPARRWRRWGSALGPQPIDGALAHTGLRAPFAFPDGTTADWVLTPDGFRSRLR
ncbi:MAG: hypothetical protein CL424_13890 [Acidimicrobiaceae bacterium]|nr:hypothetical protein [Acidimicrobiaceae bacterium]